VIDFNRGRQVFSTAFVLMGPDRRLTVELRDRRVVVLENPRANPGDFCGAVVAGPGLARGSKFCAGYAEVMAARPEPRADPFSEGPSGFGDNQWRPCDERRPPPDSRRPRRHRLLRRTPMGGFQGALSP
jgi:hypothetical protein